MNPNALKYPLDRLRETAHKWLYLDDDRFIDVMVSAHIANRFDADPVWMQFIGPPSSAKTELLNSFSGHKSAYFLSSLTEKTLISGKTSSSDKNPSLIFKLANKTLVLKDFTTVLSMRSEPKAEILSQLREIYDGQYSKAFGQGFTINWTGKIGFMAACTPVYDKHYSVIGVMGDRFLLYRNPITNIEKMGLQAQRIIGMETQMREELRIATHTFIDQFENLSDIEFHHDEVVNHQIVKLACICSYARCPVERDYRSRTVDYVPAPEGPPRLTKQLSQMGMALALAHGKTQIDEHIYSIVRKLARDAIPAQRLKIIKYLWDEKVIPGMGSYNWQTTREIANGTNTPGSTAKMHLEDLMMAGAVNRDIETIADTDSADDKGGYKATKAYIWQLTEQMYQWIGESEMFEPDFSDTQPNEQISLIQDIAQVQIA
jgi:hypothetical protein